jgi:nucleoside-diphosphate-sugar epimerase
MHSTEPFPQPRVRIVFGCGYLGLRVARRWRDVGASVVAITRSTARSIELASELIGSATADVTDLGSLEAELGPFGKLSNLRLSVESALYAVGYDRTSDVDINAVYAGGLQNVLAALPRSVSRMIYISTTGVYRTAGGDWVDEQTPPDPQREGGRASLAAEEVLRRHPLGRRSVILRLAGIYGPGRVPYLDKLRADEAIPAPSAGWLNLIHVDDAAKIVVAADDWAAAREESDGPHVFCVSDGHPVQRGDYYTEVARLVGAAPPTFTAPPPDSPVAARAAADRRIRNDKMCRELQRSLLYPTYREGLASILTTKTI